MREITVMFTDVRGFTTHLRAVRSARPDALHEPLPDADDRPHPGAQGHDRQVHGRRHHGVLECAARRRPSHAARACETALAMQARLVELNAEWKAEAEAEGRPHIPVNIGIGLNTGQATVGNFGSTQRLHLFLPGRRGEPRLAPRRPVQGLRASASSSARTPGSRSPDFAALELDLVMVKGKTEPERIYGLIGDRRRWPDAARVPDAARPAGRLPAALSHRRLRRGACR